MSKELKKKKTEKMRVKFIFVKMLFKIFIDQLGSVKRKVKKKSCGVNKKASLFNC